MKLFTCLLVLCGWLLMPNLGCARIQQATTAVSLMGSDGGKLEMLSLTNGNKFESKFDSAIYEFGDEDTVTIVMLKGTPEEPELAATLRLMWKPRAGKTPVDRSATNLTINYVVFAGDDQVGIYSGAGFMLPEGKPGRGRIGGDIRQATVRLSDSSDQFTDLLENIRLEGDVTALRADGEVQPLLRKLALKIRERLGRVRLVSAE